MKKIMVLTLFMSIVATSANGQGRIVFTPQWTAQAQFAGYYVAQEKGFYREAGIEVEIVHPSLTQSAMDRI
ncbi:MAG: ABC transporter substrate-binding protein, partial [Bacteroidales bacterium]|nr:ABC transporter substrate-binding protein [Bacteroidales bacterium]